ncbi:MAG: PAS domain-containing sensor histidine kinase [Natrialbaceae archaeon]|nr:PAS domain-containing sensor histidine kinase [Natrialbaceae archaeon]
MIPIIILDGDGRITDFNETACRLWPALAGTTGEQLDRVSSQLAAKIEYEEVTHETTLQLELTIDREKRHFSATVSPVEREKTDEVRWYAVVLRDITEIIQSREELAEQNERLDQVASTISHDLRNPIQIADGYTDFLSEDIETMADDPDVATEALEHLEEVETSLDRMQNIIDDVLTLARLGSTVEETEPVSLAAISRRAWEQVETYESTLEIDGDVELMADRSRLSSILENLFRNAVTHGRTDLTVTVGVTDMGFYVQDTGPGIEADDLDSVFDYGYTTESDGTGFGLAIVRSMAESHGWRVSIDDNYEDGARFVFELPDVTAPILTAQGEATGDE